MSFAVSVLRFRWLIMAITLIVTVVAIFGVKGLSMTSDNRVFLGPKNPELVALKAFEDIYTPSSNVFIVLQPEDGNIFTRSTLSAIEAITAEAWQLPYARRVDSLTNFQNTYANGLDDLVVENLVEDAKNLSAEQLTRIRKIALSDPLIAKRYVTQQGNLAAIDVTFIVRPEEEEEATVEIASRARELAASIEQQYPGTKLYLTGDIMLGATMGEATEDDIAILFPIMFVLIFVIAGILLRSVTATISAIAVLVVSVVFTMGLAGWLGYVLNPGSAIAPTIILTVAIADSIHIISGVLHLMSKGTAKREAIIESLRSKFAPVLITNVTTAIGFLTLNFSDAPPFHDLGNLVAIGVAISFVYSVTLLPVMLLILPLSVTVHPLERRSLFDCLGDFVVEKYKPLLGVMIALATILILGLPRIQLGDDWFSYIDKRYPLRNDTDFVIDNFSGIDTPEFSLKSGRSNGINNPEYLGTVDAFAEWLRTQPGVEHVYSITEIVKRLNKNMNGDDPNYYRIPDSAELVAQYLLVYELSLPYGQDLNDRINIDRSETRLTVVGDFPTAEMRALSENALTWLDKNAPPYMVTEATGMSNVFAHISERNINAMLGGSVLALVLISGLLIMALRSVATGLISLIPNLLPAAMAFGLWGWLVGEVGMAVSIVAAMTLGIIVDDSVHFLVHYLRARRRDKLSQADAVRYAFHTVGKALFTTTTALVAGFSVLAFSGFLINWAIGVLTGIILVIALIVDFFLLPSLLLLPIFRGRLENNVVVVKS